MPKKSLRACSAAATARWVPIQGAPLGPGGRNRRCDRTFGVAAARTGPVGAARAYASQGNDARQAAAASDPTDAASGTAKLAGHASRPTTYRAGKGKVWLSPLGLNFPALLCKSPPSATRQSPGLRPSVPLRDYLLWLFPQRLSLRSGHLELPDSSAVAAAARTVEASGSRGKGSRAVAHVLTA